jgi:4-hydroxy-3-polyprenylbenzoate decarboxylase
MGAGPEGHHCEGGELKRIIVGITGATGAIFGVRLLEALGAARVETHLVLSKWGQQTVEHELGLTLADLRGRASVVHGIANMAATLSSGSFRTAGMVVAPCSMHTAAAIAHGYGDSLVHRAADVILKERRPLVLVPRETPLSEVHLENLLKLARMGVTIVPPMPLLQQARDRGRHREPHRRARARPVRDRRRVRQALGRQDGPAGDGAPAQVAASPRADPGSSSCGR